MNSPSSPLIEAKQVSKLFGDNRVLDAVGLAISPGEIVTLIGPNGSGKTTLVRILLGLVPPSSGSVTRRPGLKVGYVPQIVHTDETLPLTVRRFLTLPRHVSKRDADGALKEVGAAHVAGTQLDRISGGEMRRVLLARALLRDPDLLVLDEPAAGVDVGGQAELYDLVCTIRDRHHCGVLMVSHDLHLVMAATDQVVCLNHHVCCTGQPDAVSRHPEYLALFGRHAGETLAVYTHHHDHQHGLSGEAIDDHGHGHGHNHEHGNG
jgi:zinc transport system ATP-binding protein